MNFGFDDNQHQWVLTGQTFERPDSPWAFELFRCWARNTGQDDAVRAVDLQHAYMAGIEQQTAGGLKTVLALLVPNLIDSELEANLRSAVAERDDNAYSDDLWPLANPIGAASWDLFYNSYWRTFSQQLNAYRHYYWNQAAAQATANATAEAAAAPAHNYVTGMDAEPEAYGEMPPRRDGGGGRGGGDYISEPDMVTDAATGRPLTGRSGYVSGDDQFYLVNDLALENLLQGSHPNALDYARRSGGSAFPRTVRTQVPANTIGVLDAANGTISAVYPQTPRVGAQAPAVDWDGVVDNNSILLESISHRKAGRVDVAFVYGADWLVLGDQAAAVGALAASAPMRGVVRFKYKKLGPCEFVLEVNDSGGQRVDMAKESLRNAVQLMLKRGSWDYLSQPKITTN